MNPYDFEKKNLLIIGTTVIADNITIHVYSQAFETFHPV